MRVSLVPFLIATFLVLSAGCSGGDDGCSAATCLTGCCDAQGLCQPWGPQTCGITGQAGLACVACSQGQACQAGRCQASCSPTSCPGGCCDAASGQCVIAISDAQCGSGGVTCMQCSGTEQCLGGSCSGGACGPANCSTCCDSSGQCVTQTSEAMCGFGGSACQACPSDRVCTGGYCQPLQGNCSPSNCNGCCDQRGNCVDVPNAGACGTGGQSCVACSGGQACNAGRCTCSPQSCPGCCDGDTCHSGSRDFCGIGGGSCKKCNIDENCSNGQCAQGCTPATCPFGCCNGNVCNHAGQTDKDACGMSANPCVMCLDNDTCENGTCNDQGRCHWGTCPDGWCCIEGACIQGNTSQACGAGTRGIDPVTGQPYSKHCRQCGVGEHCLNNLCGVNPSSRWRVEVVAVAVQYFPVRWDLFGAPDMYVEFSAGSLFKKTQKVGSDTYSEIFNEVLGEVRGDDLTQRSVQWKVMDEDNGADEVMFECIITFTGDEIRRRDVYVYDDLSDLPPQLSKQEARVHAPTRCQGGQVIWQYFSYIQFRFTNVSP